MSDTFPVLSPPVPATLPRRLLESQKSASRWLDSLLPADYRVDGCKDFIENFAPSYLEPRSVVWDIGGGRFPFVRRDRKAALHLTTVGLDIDAGELAEAGPDGYDRSVAADLLTYRGDRSGDLVICQSLLEHVEDVEAAIVSIGSILKPGGTALLFMPSRNAVYTKINFLLPEGLKSRLLKLLVHGEKPFKAFPAHYDRCTPGQIRQIALKHGFEVREQRLYFLSEYFAFCFPLYALWRAWTVLFRFLAGDRAAETFAFALRRN